MPTCYTPGVEPRFDDPSSYEKYRIALADCLIASYDPDREVPTRRVGIRSIQSILRLQTLLYGHAPNHRLLTIVPDGMLSGKQVTR